MLLKTQIRLSYNGIFRDAVRFDNMRENGGFEYTAVDYPLEHWEEMDYPQEITVTIEPGDTLNTDSDS